MNKKGESCLPCLEGSREQMLGCQSLLLWRVKKALSRGAPASPGRDG